MGAGFSGIIDALGHVLHGDAHVWDHVIWKEQPNGKIKLIAVSHTDTIMTALRGTGEMTYPQMLNDPNLKAKVKQEEVKALESWDDAIHSDTHMIVPLNKDGHVIFTKGRVYDRRAKKMLYNRDDQIVGYAKIAPTFGRRLKWIMASPSVILRIVIISVIGLLVDLFACYRSYREGEKKGEKRGYKKALMGQVPVGPASDAGLFGPSSVPGSPSSAAGSILAQSLSPFPLPLQSLSKTEFAYPTNPQISAQIQQTAAANWLNRHGSPPPYQATPPYPPPPYQATQQFSPQQQLIA